MGNGTSDNSVTDESDDEEETPVIAAPTPAADTGTTTRNVAVDFTTTALLANDTDPASLSLSLTAVSNPSNGTVALDSVTNTITFTPTANFGGSGSFQYTVSNGSQTASATVTVTVDHCAAADIANTGSFTVGAGTAGDPYVVCNKEHLGLIPTTNLAAYYLLGRDLDLTGYSAVIGDAALGHTFTGSFDGNSKTLSNYTNGGAVNGVGLFGQVGAGAVISDLTLDSFALTASGNYNGPLASYITGSSGNRATIEDITITNSTVNDTGSTGAGGLIGYANYADISNVTVSTTITANAGVTSLKGGVIGETDMASVELATFSGSISGADLLTYGGIIGVARKGTQIDKCIFSGTLRYPSPFGGFDTSVGGIVGNVDVQPNNAPTATVAEKFIMRRSISRGTIATISNLDFQGGRARYVGGLVGYAYVHGSHNYDFATVGVALTFEDNYVTTDITYNLENTDNATNSVGGLFGNASFGWSATVLLKNMYFAGTISSTTHDVNEYPNVTQYVSSLWAQHGSAKSVMDYTDTAFGGNQDFVTGILYDTQVDGLATANGGRERYDTYYTAGALAVDSTVAQALSTTDMQTASTFTNAGWSSTTWTLTNGAYPTLAWENE